MKTKPKTSFAISFFNRMNNSFASGPQNYHRAFRAQVGLGRSFVGPWNYAGESPGSIKSKPQSSSPYQGPSNTIKKGLYKQPKGFLSPSKTIGRGSYKSAKGFVSPVDGYKGSTKRTSYNYGYNQAHTEAIGDE